MDNFLLIERLHADGVNGRKEHVGTRLSIVLPDNAHRSTNPRNIGRQYSHLCSNCDLNLDARLDVDDNLLNHLGRRI